VCEREGKGEKHTHREKGGGSIERKENPERKRAL